MEKWVTRKFDVLDPNLSFPGIMERLKGTPWRLKGILEAIPEEYYTSTSDGAWSIQENIGHLLELESLWLQRIRDFYDGKEELSSADMRNTETTEAQYNSRDHEEILSAFTNHRLLVVSAFQHLQKIKGNSTSLHPRLHIPMRPVDLAFFIAEHDDHHLAAITSICNRLGIW